MTLGITLNNPGDLEFNDVDKWQGLATPPNQGRWFKFKTPVDGIRAIARTLITYQDKYNLRTIEQWITKYAPPTENDTAAYIKSVCDESGFVATFQLNAHDYRCQRAIVPAIIHHEQGSQPYSDAQIDEALRRAGIVPQQTASTTTALFTDPKVIGATVAGTAGTVQATVSSVSDIWDTLGQHIDPRYLVWSCVAVVIGFGVWYALQKIKARKEGTS